MRSPDELGSFSLLRRLQRVFFFRVRCMSGLGEMGSGAGKGGGTGGSIRDAGGALGKMEAAHEEMYFKKLEREQLQKLRKHLEEEVAYHKDQIEDHEQALQLQRMREHMEEEIEHHAKSIREHQEAIERHKKKIQKLKHQEKEVNGNE